MHKSGPDRCATRPAKRPPNAFLLFCRDERPSVCERCPSMSPCDVSSLLSHLWRSLDDESKARYKQEELRLQRECALGIQRPDPMPRWHLQFPPPDWVRIVPLPAPMVAPPPIECMPVTRRPFAQAITRRFDVRPPPQEISRRQSLHV
jgi:hypothetical protein